MNNAGTPDVTEKPKGGRGCLSSPVTLVLLGILMVVSALVLSQALPMLYTIAFPPTLALPANTEVVRHTQYEQGVDEWLYRSPIPACEMASHLQSLGIDCVGIVSCGNETKDPEQYSSLVSQCFGQQSISMFKVQWTVMLNSDPSGGSLYQVYREMFWGGQIPPKRFDDLVEDIVIEMTLTAQAPQFPDTTPAP